MRFESNGEGRMRFRLVANEMRHSPMWSLYMFTQAERVKPQYIAPALTLSTEHLSSYSHNFSFSSAGPYVKYTTLGRRKPSAIKHAALTERASCT